MLLSYSVHVRVLLSQGPIASIVCVCVSCLRESRAQHTRQTTLLDQLPSPLLTPLATSDRSALQEGEEDTRQQTTSVLMRAIFVLFRLLLLHHLPPFFFLFYLLKVFIERKPITTDLQRKNNSTKHARIKSRGKKKPKTKQRIKIFKNIINNNARRKQQIR